MTGAYSGIGSAPTVAPGAADHSQTCPCPRCRQRGRALEALIDGDLAESEIGLQAPATTVPTPGRLYQIQQGKGGLLATAGRAYGLGTGGARLNRAKEINGHPENRKYWIKPRNTFERGNFPNGIISFSPIFTCGPGQRRAQSGEKKCFARIYIPPAASPPAPAAPRPVPRPRAGPTPGPRPIPRYPDPPKVPTVPPRLMSEHQFTSLERLFARKTWNMAVKHVYHAHWFVNYMHKQDRTDRIRLWNGLSSFAGNYGDGVPKVWFGSYDEDHFTAVRHVVNKIWSKFFNSHWKMKRHDCVVWARAHVIVVGQVRLCDDFFGFMSADDAKRASEILIHEMAHHIWIKNPLRQVTDRHVSPSPRCKDGKGLARVGNPCYGKKNAKMLAQKFTKHAVANPDNYALFVSNYGRHLPT